MWKQRSLWHLRTLEASNPDLNVERGISLFRCHTVRCKSFKKDKEFFFLPERHWKGRLTDSQPDLWIRHCYDISNWASGSGSPWNLLICCQLWKSYSPPTSPHSCQLWKFKLCAFYHICHSLVVKLWHSEFGWQLCGNERKSSSTCTFQCCSQGEAEVWTRGTPASFITTITILSLVPKFSLCSLSWL